MTHHILLIGDTHGGHTHGLMSPSVELQQETETGEIVTYTPQLRAVQDWLWHDVYLPGLEKAKAEILQEPVTVLALGDPTHGVKRMQELVTTRLSDQVEIAVSNMDPIYKTLNVERYVGVIGTGSHEFEEGAASYLVGKRLEAKTGKPVETCLHLLATIGGLSIDASHHGPTPGTRLWLHGNQARYYLTDHYLSEKEARANVYVRAHYHSPVWESIKDDDWREYHIFITPPMCTPGVWTRQATRSIASVTAGMILLTIERQRIIPMKLTKKVDLRSKRAW